jgi:hypothetical protein
LLGFRSLRIPSAAFLILICQERPPEFPFFHVTAFEDPLNSFLRLIFCLCRFTGTAGQRVC